MGWHSGADKKRYLPSLAAVGKDEVPVFRDDPQSGQEMVDRGVVAVNEVCDRSVNGIVDCHLATFLTAASCVKALFSMAR